MFDWFVSRSNAAVCPASCAVAGPTARSALVQPSQHVVELIETAIVDLQHAPVAALIDRHGQAQRIGHAPLECNRIGAFERALADGLARLLSAVLRQSL